MLSFRSALTAGKAALAQGEFAKAVSLFEHCKSAIESRRNWSQDLVQEKLDLQLLLSAAHQGLGKFDQARRALTDSYGGSLFKERKGRITFEVAKIYHAEGDLALAQTRAMQASVLMSSFSNFSSEALNLNPRMFYDLHVFLGNVLIARRKLHPEGLAQRKLPNGVSSGDINTALSATLFCYETNKDRIAFGTNEYWLSRYLDLALADCDADVLFFILCCLESCGIYINDMRGNPMHQVARSQDSKLLDQLIEFGLGLETLDVNGHTPLHVAAIADCATAVKLLLERGALADSRDKEQWTPLMHAAYNENFNAMKVLLTHGADPNGCVGNNTAVDKEGRTPLHIAAMADRGTAVKLILERGALVDSRDREQWTPLMRAAQRGGINIVKILLKHGADPSAHNIAGKTAIDIANAERHSAVAQTIIAFGKCKHKLR